jgi:hypothetical protein
MQSSFWHVAATLYLIFLSLSSCNEWLVQVQYATSTAFAVRGRQLSRQHQRSHQYLSQTFSPSTAITNSVSPSAAGELLRPSTPPHPPAQHVPRRRSSPPAKPLLLTLPVRSELLTIYMQRCRTPTRTMICVGNLVRNCSMYSRKLSC